MNRENNSAGPSCLPIVLAPRLLAHVSAFLLAVGVCGLSGCGSPAAAQPTKTTPPAQAAATRAAAARARSPFLFQPPPASRAFEAWTLRETVEDAVSRIGGTAVPELRRWLSDPNPELRRNAADLLGRIGPESSEAIPDLIILLDDESPSVRKHAARALGQIGPSAAESTPALMRILREEVLKEQANANANPNNR